VIRRAAGQGAAPCRLRFIDERNRDLATVEGRDLSLCVVTHLFSVEVPPQNPQNSIDGKEQHKAEQDG